MKILVAMKPSANRDLRGPASLERIEFWGEIERAPGRFFGNELTRLMHGNHQVTRWYWGRDNGWQW